MPRTRTSSTHLNPRARSRLLGALRASVVNWLALPLALTLLLSLPLRAQQVITLRSQAPLVELKVMVRAGSAMDPAGREGLAHLTARMLLEGSFGDPKAPVTKEKLAEITRPWGELALPTVRVDKETTTFSATVPRDAYAEFLSKVWGPMFTQPLFAAPELERIRKEVLVFLTSELRYENAERLGLEVLDEQLLGGGFAHPVEGAAGSLGQVTREDVRGFFRSFYRPARMAVASATNDSTAGEKARQAVAGSGQQAAAGSAARAAAPAAPPALNGRQVLLVSQPNAIATGIHAGFPFAMTRANPDFWPLFVANVFFGTHRDSFGRLYGDIREDRGYNYGDYSYLEWVAGRYALLFPPPATPRARQYFSIWIRPVGHQYAHHIMKALTWELENFIRRGMTPDEVKLSKDKARILYLSLAETAGRLLGYRLDDWFYGVLDRGYMETYLKNIEAVTPEQVNAAIRKYLQAKNLRYVVITDEPTAQKLKNDLPTGQNARGKSPAEYQLEAVEKDGVKVWMVPERKLEILRLDKVWEEYPLEIPASNIRVVSAKELFQ